MKNNLNLILLAVLTMVLFASACGDKNAAEANKFVESANKKTQEAKEMVDKMPKNIGQWIDDTKDIAESQKAHEAEAKETLKKWDKIIETEKSAAGDFREAVKLNSDQTYKNYYEALAKQMDIQVEKGNTNKSVFQSFLDSSDWDAFGEKAGSFKAKMQDLQKQDADNAAQITKLETSLPNAKK
ncbi:MAG: hypothetical protein ABJA66_20625 [Actinomycetota bacterium]